jgi:putative tryptophan/tyrosine transport system substrate-binding protein
MTRRNVVLTGLVAILCSAGSAAFAENAEKVHRLGVLSPGAGPVERMRAITFPELARLGFTEGRNLVIDIRIGPREQMPALAHNLTLSRPEVIIAVSAAAIRAIHQADGAIPIVGAFIGEDRITAGFAASLARPGGMITGIVMLAPELDAKRLYLLQEAVPGARHIAALAANQERDAPNLTAVKDAADRTGIKLLPFFGATPDDYRAAFAAMHRAEAEALEIVSAPELYSDASKLAVLAVETRLPTICEWAEMARSGCLLGYGPDYTELQHSVANYVARIFRGAAPGELPIEGPTHFRFAINLKTAKALGLTIPPSIIARADEVIE